MKHIVVVSALAFSCLTLPLDATAQDEFRGFSGTFALGPGAHVYNGILADTPAWGTAVVLRLGWAVSSRMALGVDVSGWLWDAERELGNGNVAATVTWRPLRRGNLFLTGGVGRAIGWVDRVDGTPGVIYRERGVGWTGSIGYDLHVVGSLYLVPSFTAMLQDIGPRPQGLVLSTVGIAWH